MVRSKAITGIFSIVVLCFICVATAWYYSVPTLFSSLVFNQRKLERAAKCALSGKLALLHEWKSKQYEVPTDIVGMKIDGIAVEGNCVIFHQGGTGLATYDEYLVYSNSSGSPPSPKLVSYLNPAFGFEIQDIRYYNNKWAYVKIGQR